MIQLRCRLIILEKSSDWYYKHVFKDHLLCHGSDWLSSLLVNCSNPLPDHSVAACFPKLLTPPGSSALHSQVWALLHQSQVASPPAPPCMVVQMAYPGLYKGGSFNQMAGFLGQSFSARNNTLSRQWVPLDSVEIMAFICPSLWFCKLYFGESLVLFFSQVFTSGQQAAWNNSLAAIMNLSF